MDIERPVQDAVVIYTSKNNPGRTKVNEVYLYKSMSGETVLTTCDDGQWRVWSRGGRRAYSYWEGGWDYVVRVL